MLAATALFLAGKQYRGLIRAPRLVGIPSVAGVRERALQQYSGADPVARTDSLGGNFLTARLYAGAPVERMVCQAPGAGNGRDIPFTVDNRIC